MNNEAKVWKSSKISYRFASRAFCLALAALRLRQHMTRNAKIGKMKILETIGTTTTFGSTEKKRILIKRV